jgi:uncharacterized SAM-binding protein YcdF (DUF218 family)
MLYYLVGDLLNPLTFAVLLLVYLLVRWQRTGSRSRAAWLAAVFIVLIASHPLTSRTLIRTLERDQPFRVALPTDVGAIVVLGGGLSVGPGGVTLAEDSLERTVYAASVYRRIGPRLVVASGGQSRSTPGAPPIGSFMRDLLVELGVPASSILVEGRSATTYENAVYSRALLEPRSVRRIILVTEAMHLPRAVRAFSAQGFDVVPVGCGYVTGASLTYRDLLPNAGAALGVQRATHEWLGLLWYWGRGYFR